MTSARILAVAACALSILDWGQPERPALRLTRANGDGDGSERLLKEGITLRRHGAEARAHANDKLIGFQDPSKIAVLVAKGLRHLLLTPQRHRVKTQLSEARLHP